MIRVQWSCPNCEQIQLRDLEAGTTLRCKCGHEQRIEPQQGGEDGSIEADDGEMLHRCPLCGTEELYLQKDFPERIGVLLVVSGVVLATIAWYYHSWFGTFGILFAFGAVDWILFHTRKDVTVCYRCHAQFRGATINPDHRAFDLGIGERYRQERLRREQMRASESPSP